MGIYLQIFIVCVCGTIVGFLIGYLFTFLIANYYDDGGALEDSKIQDFDSVNHPSYYFHSSIECKDVIKALVKDEGYKGYLKGNIIKYIWREQNKGHFEDVQKAKFYLNELEVLMSQDE